MTTHEAGRELDGLVAEKVMGWQQFPYLMGHADDSGIVQQWGVSTVTIHHCPPGRTHVSTITRVPAYSTDIADAWLVVDKLMEQAYAVTVYVSHDGIRVGVVDGSGRVQGVSVDPREGNVALAICRAALEAVGVK